MAEETILVVDDSASIRNFVVKRVLEPHGYTALEATNGEAALPLIKRHAPALIVTDLKMPRMDGLDLLLTLREQDIQIPAILMTFHGSEEIAIEAFRMGVRDYLVKPFTDEEMLAAIERALSEVRLRRERDRLVDDLMLANRTQQRHIQELEALFGVGKMLTGLPDDEALMTHVVQTAHDLIGAVQASVLLIEDDYLLQRVIMDRRMRFLSRRMDSALAWEAIDCDCPLAGDPYRETRLGRTVVEVCAPIIIGSTPLGALRLLMPPGQVTEHQLKLVDALADYAAIGLEQAYLLASTQGRG